MYKNAKRIVDVVTILGSTAILSALLMVGGCGSGSSTQKPASATESTAIPATSVTAGPVGAPDGSITVAPGTAVTANTSSNLIAISIPAGVTIVPPAGTTFSAATPPSIIITTISDVSVMPAPMTAGFVLDSMAGAIDIKIGDHKGGLTFTGGKATITIPITGTVANCDVFANEDNGTGYEYLGEGACSNGFATIKVSHLSQFVVNPMFKNGIYIVTGATGGPGGRGF